MAEPLPVAPLEAQLAFARELHAVTEAIHAAPGIHEILVGLAERIRKLLGCEGLTIYAVDVRNQQLYSIFKVHDDRRVIRVAKDASSLAGHCAATRKAIQVEDAYDAAELARVHPRLAFDRSWDDASGFRTRAVLAVPLLMDKYLLGVLQLVNKVGGRGFSEGDRRAADEIARTLAVAFYNQNRAARGGPGGRRHPFSGLVDRGVISEADLEAAAGRARVSGRDLASVLLGEAHVAKKEIGRSLAEFYGVPFYEDDGKRVVPAELRDRIPAEFWRSNVCAPLAKRGGALRVVCLDPFDLEKIDAIKSTGIAASLDLEVGLEGDVLALLERSFGAPSAAAGPTVPRVRGGGAAGVEPSATDPATADELEAAADGFIVRLAEKTILDAIDQGASDIHVEPNGAEAPVRIRFRRDGDCYVVQEVPAEHRAALVSRLKILAQLDISEKRKPQDGKIRFRRPDGQITELRVATVPTAGEGNEDVVMRLLAASRPIPLEGLGMSARNLSLFKEIVTKPYGLVLCVGPTGSGKTTTLHSALGYVNTEDVKIWTAEDPVEITQAGLRQVQVRPKIGFDFSAAMRSFLRADPDIIMLGEMRDAETAGVGIEASLTGHLVLSTLHTNSAPETVTRLLDMGLDPFNFADALLGVLAQRLVRTLCPSCKEAHPADERELVELREAWGSDRPVDPEVPLQPGLVLQRARGCERCGGSGYRGRLAVHELLVASDAIKRLVIGRRPVEEIRSQAMAEGMRTLLQDGVWKVTRGDTDLKQVKAVCLR